MGDVNINTATPWQLSVLLDLTRGPVEALLLARPFADEERFREALAPHRSIGDLGLFLPKRNINAAGTTDIVRATGISNSVARRIVESRPFFFSRQLQALIGEADYRLVELIYTVPEFEYVDKLTAHPVRLSPDPSRVLVSKAEMKDVESLVDHWKLTPVFPHATGSLYEVLEVPETEEATELFGELQKTYSRNVIPAYRDDRASFRYFNPKFCTVQFASRPAGTTYETIIAQQGLLVEEAHRTPGMYTLRIPEAQMDPLALVNAVRGLNAMTEVAFAEPNYLGFDDREILDPPRLFRAREEAEDAGSVPWNLSMLRAPEAWSWGRGSSDVLIAVIDSGVDTNHPSLEGAVLRPAVGESWNFANDDNPEPRDEEGHGTFIAGLLVGNGAQNVHGIAPGCRVLPLKVPLRGEVTSYARRRDAILYALDKVGSHQSLIINLSWKTSGDVALIRDAVDQAVSRGATVVASAGNFPSRENEPHYPSDYRPVISVAAVGPDRKRAYYSFYGDEVDVSAPGGDDTSPGGSIHSAAPNSMVTSGVGTSFAAPHIAGVAALLASANRLSTPLGIRSVVESSAVPIADRGMGQGLADAAAALRSSSSPPNEVLDLINSAEFATLVTRFRLLAYTARILISRRPFASITQLQMLPGLTPEQYSSITNIQSDSTTALALLNSADVANLVSTFGLLAYTARLIIARRPFRRVEEIRGISGLTEEQYMHFAG